jgi:hypothetical protein
MRLFEKMVGDLSFIKEGENGIINYRYKSYLDRPGKAQHKRRCYHQRLRVGRFINRAPESPHL